MKTLRFLWMAYQAYAIAQQNGVCYASVSRHGVPQIAMFIGVDRAAWKISVRAIEEKWEPSAQKEPR